MKLHPRVTRSLVELVKRFEGLRRNSARLSDGGWTIGYGHTRSARSGVVVSPEDAEALLYYDLSQVAEKVEAWTFTPLNQNQFEALTAFAFNIGLPGFRTSSVLKQINEGQILRAAESLELWRKAEFDGEAQIVDALVRRRAAEKAHFLTPPEGFRPSPSPVLRPVFDPPSIPAARLSDPSQETASIGFDAGLGASSPDPETLVLRLQSSASTTHPEKAPATPSSSFIGLGAAAAAFMTEGVEDKPFGHGVRSSPDAAPGSSVRAVEPPPVELEGASPFQPPPPPLELVRKDEAPFPSAPAAQSGKASGDEAMALGPSDAGLDNKLRARRRPPSASLFRGDHTLLFGATGCVGVAFLAAALFSILFSHANPLNLIVGLIGIVLLTPAGAFFSIRFLNVRDALPDR